MSLVLSLPRLLVPLTFSHTENQPSGYRSFQVIGLVDTTRYCRALLLARSRYQCVVPI